MVPMGSDSKENDARKEGRTGLNEGRLSGAGALQLLLPVVLGNSKVRQHCSAAATAAFCIRQQLLLV